MDEQTKSQGLTRREMLKTAAIQGAVAAAAALCPDVIFAAPKRTPATPQSSQSSQNVAWKKAPCRFCGTGCGVLIGVMGGKAVAVKGDPHSPVNKGTLCVKGYHSIQALYAKDRLEKAYIRRGNKFVAVPIKEALDLVAKKMQQTIKTHGKDAVAMYGSGQWAIPDGYVASKFIRFSREYPQPNLKEALLTDLVAG